MTGADLVLAAALLIVLGFVIGVVCESRSSDRCDRERCRAQGHVPYKPSCRYCGAEIEERQP